MSKTEGDRRGRLEVLWKKVRPLGWSRREFLALFSSGGVAAVLSACSTAISAPRQSKSKVTAAALADTGESPGINEPRQEYEYVVVGSGAGGGSLAANLARKGHRVLLLEAGGVDTSANYSVPAFHGLATEDPALSWQYFVKHYADQDRQRRDPKKVVGADDEARIFYPRAGTLGGCTAHYAMIIIYPHNRDWEDIARLTEDDSWKAENMRQYFVRLERYLYTASSPTNDDDKFHTRVLKNKFLDLLRFLQRLIDRDERHGDDGWLPTSRAPLELVAQDPQLLELLQSVTVTATTPPYRLRPITARLDPNDWEVAQEKSEGLVRTPMATDGKFRRGVREYVLQTHQEHPERLFIETEALVTNILFGEKPDEDGVWSAIGVEYLKGPHLYEADPAATKENQAGKRQVFVTREVILSAGAFNTPQLLMLSGIGPKKELEKHGISPIRVDLPGVGKNLQDRYEVGVISEMRGEFPLLKDAKFTGGDEDLAFDDWKKGRGLYTTNGVVLGIIKRSRKEMTEDHDPDLFIFGTPGHFEGYKPGWSREAVSHKNHFTWVILKAHTKNTNGAVTLHSADPRATPEINFHYFDEGNDDDREDLRSVVEGVKFVRAINQRMKQQGLITRAILPTDDVLQGDETIEQFVKDNAWGHHACGTCKMGPSSEPLAVVDGKFRVHGTRNLRVVDASIFPKIPGFFIVTPIYMISEKASDVIHEAALSRS